MKHRVIDLVASHPRKLALLTIATLLLVFGAAGEAAAHNPAGQPVPGCENGAETVVEQNPNCHPDE